MKTFILYNPLSGHGKALEKANEIVKLYEDEEIIDITKIDDTHAFLLDITAEDKLVICGGDGTLNRFVYETEGIDIPCEVLYCATGTGNDFLKDIGKSADDAPFRVNEYIADLPVVEVNGKKYRFLNGVGFGIDGYCCEVGDKLKAADPEKPVNYTSIAIKGLLYDFKPKNATVRVDGVEYKYPRVWIAAAMHGRYYGGGMNCAPDQDRLNTDGTNTLVVWYGSGKLKTLMNFPSIFKGEHITHTDMIAVHKGHEIEVEFDKPCALQIDGETFLNITGYKVTSSVPAKKEAEIN